MISHCTDAGEVDFKSFCSVLRKINPAPGTMFYDLGSGTGKAVFIARLTQDFARCVGIEILHGLHSQAQKIVDRSSASEALRCFALQCIALL